jgi:hypothetical protein
MSSFTQDGPHSWGSTAHLWTQTVHMPCQQQPGGCKVLMVGNLRYMRVAPRSTNGSGGTVLLLMSAACLRPILSTRVTAQQSLSWTCADPLRRT